MFPGGVNAAVVVSVNFKKKHLCILAAIKMFSMVLVLVFCGWKSD